MTMDLELLRSTQLYRPGRRHIDEDYSSHLWAEPVDRLLAAGYSFFPGCYGDEGYLFRGMQSGLNASLIRNTFGYFDGEDEMCGVEKAMGIYFLTSEISDAVTVSRLQEGSGDAAIIAIHASVFNEYLDRHAAAVLAVGDGGIVFRYPFLTEPLPETAVEWLFVHASREEQPPARFRDRCIALDGADRKELEANLSEHMKRRNIRPAIAVPTEHYPKLYP